MSIKEMLFGAFSQLMDALGYVLEMPCPIFDTFTIWQVALGSFIIYWVCRIIWGFFE